MASHTAYLWDPRWPLERCPRNIDVLMPRLGNYLFHEALDILPEYEKRARYTVNGHLSYEKARNKWTSWLAFFSARMPIPFSQLAESELDLKWERSFPCIIKELESSKGKGTHLANNLEHLSSIATNISKPFLIQEAFQESFGEDIRILVMKQKIIASMKRTSHSDFRSNIALGGQGEPVTLSEAECQLAVQAAETLGLQLAGIDILRTHKGPILLEANPCPGLEGIEKFTLRNVARDIIQRVEESYGASSP